MTVLLQVLNKTTAKISAFVQISQLTCHCQVQFYQCLDIASLLLLWLDTFCISQKISQPNSENLKKQMMLNSSVSTLFQRIFDISQSYIESNQARWSSIKYLRSDIVTSDPPPSVRAHTLLTYITSPLVRVYGQYFLKKL